jgi:DNA-binding HxlR family transcriptional regulator
MTTVQELIEARPLQKVLSRLSNKWNVLVIRRLSRKTMRHSQLKRDIGNISQKMLTQTLRELERSGLIERKVYPVIPPKVEYSLTELGQTLVAPLDVLCDWALVHNDDVENAVKVYDAKKELELDQ